MIYIYVANVERGSWCATSIDLACKPFSVCFIKSVWLDLHDVGFEWAALSYHMVFYIEVKRLTSHDHVTKPAAMLSGKKCTIVITSACLRSFCHHGKELLCCWLYKQVHEK